MPLDNLLLSIFQFFTDKARDAAADRLGNGDVGNERFREFIKRDLHEIETKLDNLSKIDLCSSLNYLEEGFLLLFNCIDKVENDRECEEASNNDESQATCTAITTRYDLSRAIQHSKDFELAIDRFKKSREKATDVFNNKNLSLEDRIFAVIVKIMAQIFECPENRKNLIDLCLSYIKKLHELDGVRKMFSVFIGGGMRAKFNKSQRMENIKSVILLNHHLYQFIARINNNHDHLSTWPSIELRDGKMFNPIQDWRKQFAVETWNKNLIESSQEMEKMKTMMFELLDKITINEHFASILTSSVKLVMDLLRSDILVAGGFTRGSSGFLKSVEIFSWKEKKWFEIASMKNAQVGASSFIYNDNLFVVGGRGSKSMENINIKLFPLTWKIFSTELHYEYWGHQIVVYKQQIFLIGGHVAGKGRSDLISEIKITGTTSYVLKELCHMPETRYGHGAVVVDDKVLIIGGNGKDCKVLSSVLEFDPKTLTFKEMPPLTHPLTWMARVQWRDQVVLLGGYDDRSEKLNSVIMYDIKKGKITVLPSMLEKRAWCCAVITGDTIVVMGGFNHKNEDLKSVECFEMGSSSSWTYLPSMNKPRCEAIAEVLPFGQKYV